MEEDNRSARWLDLKETEIQYTDRKGRPWSGLPIKKHPNGHIEVLKDNATARHLMNYLEETGMKVEPYSAPEPFVPSLIESYYVKRALMDIQLFPDPSKPAPVGEIIPTAYDKVVDHIEINFDDRSREWLDFYYAPYWHINSDIMSLIRTVLGTNVIGDPVSNNLMREALVIKKAMLDGDSKTEHVVF